MAGLVWSQGFNHAEGGSALVTYDTIDAQVTDYGSWVRACSTGQTFTARDSGAVVIKLTGLANLSARQRLYVGLDKAHADSTVADTGYVYSNIQGPWRGQGTGKYPFVLMHTFSADSADAFAAPVATFSTGSSTDRIVVENVFLQVSMIATKAD